MNKKRSFKEMNYHEVQRDNSKKRSQLLKEEQGWLRSHGYKNIGWTHVIKLSEKLEEILEDNPFEKLSLEELFLEADRIGNKYQTALEIEEYNQKLAKEVSEVAEEIDKQFPDTEIEIIDFTKTNRRKNRNNQKSYKTVKS